MKLEKSSDQEAKNPVLFVVMDGVGVGKREEGDAVRIARTPVLDRLKATCPYLELKAHGTAVGLPSDGDMGNSEVGHNALGSGRVFAQGAKLVNEAIATGSLFEGSVWRDMMSRCEKGGALHLIGLLSDGNVHSHIDQVFALIKEAHNSKVERLFMHILLDGRDVPETSALSYVDALEQHLASFDGCYKIASGGGRMLVTMDRYEANWSIVELGWKTHVLGEGDRFASAKQAIEALRERDPGVIDQFLPSFVIGDDKGPTGPIQDGDSVIFFNFRGDRAIEISKAFDQDDFDHFDRVRRPDVLYAGMMEYDGDYQIPKSYLVDPPHIDRTMGEYLATNGVRQFACSETQKYGHVTYFWNGNRGGKFSDDLETYVEITSDRVQFSERPWMKAAEISDAVIEALKSGDYQFLRINYANGDMVGHTGNLDATVIAVETVDMSLGRVLEVVRRLKGVALVTADHGNADEMYMWDKKKKDFKRDGGKIEAKTAHTLNPVPLYLYDASKGAPLTFREDVEAPGLANLAATVLQLLGYEAPEGYEPSLLKR